MNISGWPLLLLAMSAVVHPQSEADELRLEAKEGRVLVRTFAKSGECVAVRSTFWSGRTEFVTSSECQLVVRDEVTECAGGRPTELERTYDEIARKRSGSYEGNVSYIHGDTHLAECSDVQGETVTFSWDEDEEKYIARCTSLDREQLQNLQPDYEFGGLLPEDEVAKGDEWNIAPEVVLTLLDPWSGIVMEAERLHGWSPPSDDLDIVNTEGDGVDVSYDGELVATYVGTKVIDGVRVAILALEGEIETDLTVDRPSASFLSYAEVSATHTIEGKATWNLGGGYLHLLKVEIELLRIQTMGMNVPNPTPGAEFEEMITEKLTGKQAFSVTCKEVELKRRE